MEDLDLTSIGRNTSSAPELEPLPEVEKATVGSGTARIEHPSHGLMDRELNDVEYENQRTCLYEK